MRPPKYKCKAYCKDYPCNRSNCDREVLFNYRNDTITMEEPAITKPITRKIQKGIWSGNRTTFINDIH